MKTIRAIVSNRITTVLGPYSEKLREAFAFRPPGYYWMPKYRDGIWDGWIHRLRRTRNGNATVPTGLFRAYGREIAEKLKIRWAVDSRFTPTEFREIEGSDREYQNQCIEAMMKAAQFGGGLILASTGTGKTYTVGLFLKALVGSACFIVDELTLLAQAREELSRAIGEEVGEIGQGHFDPRRITVATSQSLYLHQHRRDYAKWLRGLQVLIVDEIHVQLNRRNFSVIESIRPPAVFGLTATLEIKERHIQMSSYGLAGPVVFRFPLREATGQGFLTRGIVLLLEIETPMITTDYGEGIGLLTRSRYRNNVIAELADEAARAGRKVAILVERISHIKTVARLLRPGLKYRSVYGAVKSQERREAIRELERGEVDVIIASRVFSKGVNIPLLDFIIDATASRSANSAVQRYGRGTRKAEGKRGLIYVDLSDVGNSFESSSRDRSDAFRAEGIRVFRTFYQPTMPVKRIVERAIQLSEETADEVQNEVQTSTDSERNIQNSVA